MSPRHAAALLGLTNTWGALAGLLGVCVTGALLEATGHSWRLSLFYPCIGCVLPRLLLAAPASCTSFFQLAAFGRPCLLLTNVLPHRNPPQGLRCRGGGLGGLGGCIAPRLRQGPWPNRSGRGATLSPPAERGWVPLPRPWVAGHHTHGDGATGARGPMRRRTQSSG